MLFQFGIMLKRKKNTVINYTECAYGPLASVYTVTVQADNLSHSMQIAKGG